MSKSLYTVVLVKRDILRDIKLNSILEDGEILEFLPEGSNFDYIFGLNNGLSDKLHNHSRIYKTLNGAKKFRDNYNSDISLKLRYIRNISKSDYVAVVMEVTKLWDDLIDSRIEKLTSSYNDSLDRLKSKKSGN